jgi:hypothetical protein
MSTCSGLAALDFANTKFARGYSATGVGMGVCARHEFVQPNGVGDLQKGERYVFLTLSGFEINLRSGFVDTLTWTTSL